MSVDPAQIAAEADLYVTSQDLVDAANSGMTIGNHTWSHVHCRLLDSMGVEVEVAHNQRFLEAIVERPVDAFSFPYGSGVDATDEITSELARLGLKAAFLVDSRLNRVSPDVMRLFRVSVGSVDPSDLFTDLEVLPALRSLRDRISWPSVRHGTNPD
jgi:peptidoglycan/xylan/chitin deacetylase (PgdA/CDA1 family)